MRYASFRSPAPRSMHECQECKTFCRGEELVERASDGLLVCPACNHIEPQSFAIVEVAKPPRLSSPITLPEHPPTVEPAEGFDMRVVPTFR